MDTEFGTNSVHTQKLWARRLARETLGKMYFRRFAGTSEESIIQIVTDLEKSAGDTIYYDLLTQMRAPGVQGDTRLKGFEEALTFHQDTLKIDQLRQAHLFKVMSQQRTVHDLRMAAKRSLSTWYAWVFDTLMFAYLAGHAGDFNENVSAILGASGFAGNPLQAPDAAHEADLYSEGAFNLRMLDKAVELAKTVNPMVRPTMVNGQPKYVCVMHPYTVTSLKVETGTAGWADIQKQAANRGPSNPIYTGALGEYNGVVMHESEFTPHRLSGASQGANAAYSLLLGAQAGCFALGNAHKKSNQGRMGRGQFFRWTEDDDDYGNDDGVGVASIFGIKKTRFNGADFGVIRIVSNDAAHA